MTKPDPKAALTEGLNLAQARALPDAHWFLKEALAGGERGLDFQKGFAETSFGLGYLKDAKAAYKAVLKEEPANEAALLGLGRIAMKARNFKEAKEILEKTKSSMGLVELGLVEEAIENPKKALEHYLTASSKNPGLYEGILEEADKYLFLDLRDMAHFYLMRAERVAPPGPQAPYGLGYRYFTLGFMADAERCFKTHIERRPTLKGFRDLADLYEKTNNLKAAAETLEAPLQYFADDPRTNQLKALVDLRGGDAKAAISRLEAMRDKAEGDQLVLSEILNTLAKAYNQEKDFVKAGKLFAAAQAAKKKSEDFARIDATIMPDVVANQRSMDPKALARAKKGGDEPVFLLGFHRSGTTLLQNILDGSKEAESAEERGILDGVMTFVEATTGGYPKGLETLKGEDLDRLQGLYLEWAGVQGRTGKAKVFVDKNPLNVLHPALISMLFPKAKIVFAVRNPYAVVVSCWMQNFALNPATANLQGLADIVRFYVNAMETWQHFEKAGVFDLHRARYEDLVSDIEGTTKAMCTYLGIKFSPAMTAFHKTAAGRADINTASYAQVTQPLFKDGVDRFSAYQDFLALYKDDLDPWCKAFGYPGL